MCGRFIVLSEDARSELREIFDEINRRFPSEQTVSFGEIFPTHTPPVVTPDGPRPMYWGFPRKTGGVVINARAETVHTNAFFRDSFARQRCMIPASGFYEWRTAPGGKVRHRISLRDGPLYMAGVYRPFRSLAGRGGMGFVILTAQAWPQMAAIHSRMPVLLTTNAPDLWLDPDAPPDRLLPLLSPAPLPLQIEPALTGEA